MYGCSDAYIIYGFIEGNIDKVISYDTLEQYNINLYAANIVRNYLCEAAYGVHCMFNNETGTVVAPSDEDKLLVQTLYNKYAEYHGDKNKSVLGYYLVVSGDFEVGHESYDL